jgi:hypothetical protein
MLPLTYCKLQYFELLTFWRRLSILYFLPPLFSVQEGLCTVILFKKAYVTVILSSKAYVTVVPYKKAYVTVDLLKKAWPMLF